jgi:hypothetical protein
MQMNVGDEVFITAGKLKYSTGILIKEYDDRSEIKIGNKKYVVLNSDFKRNPGYINIGGMAVNERILDILAIIFFISFFLFFIVVFVWVVTK